jgi:hypothetical protein
MPIYPLKIKSLDLTGSLASILFPDDEKRINFVQGGRGTRKSSMTILVKSNLNVHKVKGRFFSNGEIKSVEGYSYRPAVGKDSQLLQTYKLDSKNDSTFIETKTGKVVKTYIYPGRGMMHLGINP